MHTRRLWIAAVVIIICFAWLGVANAQKVHVKGYVRKDGTVVQPHDRSRPGTKGGTSAGSAGGTATGTKSESGGSTKTTKNKSLPPAPPVTSTTTRDEDGHVKRSDVWKHQFMAQSGYPNGRPGYVVDHVVPLACDGADAPSNMQWHTVEAAKAKDKVERKGCWAYSKPRK
jgi:hypothetical protein